MQITAIYMRKFNNLQKLIYKITIIIKGINGLLELLGGLLITIISSASIYKIAGIIFRHELTDDPSDFIVNKLLIFARDLSFSMKEFIGFYLIIHGLINLGLFYTVWRKKLHFYPIAIVVLTLLAFYQLFRFLHRYSPMLLVITISDFIIIYFVTNEYLNAKKKK